MSRLDAHHHVRRPASAPPSATGPGPRRRVQLTFVLDHLSKPPIARGELQPWASLIRELAALTNVFCKLSGMVTEAEWHRWSVAALRPYADVLLDAFGPERVMLGSDWPVCPLAASYEEVIDVAEALPAELTAAERSHVFAVTAERAYGLGERDGRGRAGDGGPVGLDR